MVAVSNIHRWKSRIRRESCLDAGGNGGEGGKGGGNGGEGGEGGGEARLAVQSAPISVRRRDDLDSCDGDGGDSGDDDGDSGSGVCAAGPAG